MAVKVYKPQPANLDSVTKCVHWCQNQLELRDWEVGIEMSEEPPKAFAGDDGVLKCAGKCVYEETTKHALIWINTSKHKPCNYYSVAVHEMLHLFFEGKMDSEEILVCILEPLVYRLFCRENKIKIAPENEITDWQWPMKSKKRRK